MLPAIVNGTVHITGQVHPLENSRKQPRQAQWLYHQQKWLQQKYLKVESAEERIDREGGSSELLDASSGCCSGSLNFGPKLSMSLIQMTFESDISRSEVALAAGGGRCMQWKHYHWTFNNADADRVRAIALEVIRSSGQRILFGIITP